MLRWSIRARTGERPEMLHARTSSSGPTTRGSSGHRPDGYATLAERGPDFRVAALVFADTTFEVEDDRRGYGKKRIVCFGLPRGEWLWLAIRRVGWIATYAGGKRMTANKRVSRRPLGSDDFDCCGAVDRVSGLVAHSRGLLSPVPCRLISPAVHTSCRAAQQVCLAHVASHDDRRCVSLARETRIKKRTWQRGLHSAFALLFCFGQ